MTIIPDTPYDSGYEYSPYTPTWIRVSTINDGSFSLYQKYNDDTAWTQLGQCGTFEKICEDFHRTHRVGANGSATTFKVIHDGRPSYNRLCFTSVVYLSSWNGRKLFNQELHKEHWDTVEEAYREMMLEYFYVFSARFRERDFL